MRVAERWRPSNFSTMGYAWLSSRNLHTRLKRMERFARILGNRFTFHYIKETSSNGYLLQQLTSGEPSAQELSRALGLSQRTLQRKLHELSLTYQSVLHETRQELARRYLDGPSKSVTKITFLLGFSEQSAFPRAFKRWSGISPSAYRYIPMA